MRRRSGEDPQGSTTNGVPTSGLPEALWSGQDAKKRLVELLRLGTGENGLPSKSSEMSPRVFSCGSRNL